MQEYLLALLTYFLGILTMLAKDILFSGRLKWKEKRQLAKDVLVLVDEAQTSGYEIQLGPEKMKEVNRLISLTLPISKTLSMNLQSLYGAWAIFSFSNPDTFKVASHQYLDHIKNLNDQKKALDGIVKDIREEVTKWLR